MQALLPLVGVLLAVAAVATLVALARHLIAVGRQRSSGTTTTGVVIDVRKEADPRPVEGSQTAYFPLVEFTDIHGDRRTFWNAQRVGPRPNPGDPIQVWYDPDDTNVSPQVSSIKVGATVVGYLAVAVFMGLIAWIMLSWR